MKDEWRGEPVAGGTFPAAIWHDFVRSALVIDGDRKAKEIPAARRDRHAGRLARPGQHAGAAGHRGTRRARAGGGAGARARQARSRRPGRRRRHGSDAGGPHDADPARPDRPWHAAERRDGPGRSAAARGRRRGLARREGRAQAGRPGARDAAGARKAEAPGQLGRLGDADARPDHRIADRAGALGRRHDRDGPLPREPRCVERQVDAERLGELAGAGAQVRLVVAPAAAGA